MLLCHVIMSICYMCGMKTNMFKLPSHFNYLDQKLPRPSKVSSVPQQFSPAPWCLTSATQVLFFKKGTGVKKAGGKWDEKRNYEMSS